LDQKVLGIKLKKWQTIVLILFACVACELTTAWPTEVFNQFYLDRYVSGNSTIGIGPVYESTNSIGPVCKPTYSIELNRTHAYSIIVGDLGDWNKTKLLSHDLAMVEKPSRFEGEPVSLILDNSSAVYIAPVDLDGNVNMSAGAIVSTNKSTNKYYVLIFGSKY
jgi:hypothetical protein